MYYFNPNLNKFINKAEVRHLFGSAITEAGLADLGYVPVIDPLADEPELRLVAARQRVEMNEDGQSARLYYVLKDEADPQAAAFNTAVSV